MVCAGMAYVGMAYISMAYVVMAYIAVSFVGNVDVWDLRQELRLHLVRGTVVGVGANELEHRVSESTTHLVPLKFHEYRRSYL